MSLLVFVHIPKTAGTTLHKILTHQYPPPDVFIRHDFEGEPDSEWLAGVRRKSSAGQALVLGHLSVGIHHKIPGIRYITCMRDPVPRIISHYRHALNDPTHYLHKEANSLSLSKYVSSGLSGELSNGMTRMLAGIADFHHGEVDDDTFRLAVTNLENLFAGIIPSERFDEGLLLLARDLGWKTPYYLRRKVGRYPGRTAKPDPETIRVIEKHNRHDRQLFDLCAARFAERADADSDLPRQLARFRKTNRCFGGLIFTFREIRIRTSLFH